MQTRNSGIWIIFIAIMLILLDILQTARHSKVVPYSEFERALNGGLIAEVIVDNQTIQGRLKKNEGQKAILITIRSEPDLALQQLKYKVPFGHADENIWLKDLISWGIPPLCFFGILMVLQIKPSDQ